MMWRETISTSLFEINDAATLKMFFSTLGAALVLFSSLLISGARAELFALLDLYLPIRLDNSHKPSAHSFGQLVPKK